MLYRIEDTCLIEFSGEFCTLFISVYDLSLHNNNAHINKNEREQPKQMQLKVISKGFDFIKLK